MKLYDVKNRLYVHDLKDEIIGYFHSINIQLDEVQTVKSVLYRFIPEDGKPITDANCAFRLRHDIEWYKQELLIMLGIEDLEIILLRPVSDMFEVNKIQGNLDSKLFVQGKVNKDICEVPEAIDCISNSISYKMTVGIDEVLKDYLNLSKNEYHLVIMLNCIDK
ncbi:hypothetical protein [Lactococcus lactis]|uniref:hypothetical protein n=1 Tax=Lactococcus lactis TaxID=1358 RepID=UPI00071D96A8|nr:hypothetical protein [Lactococcus lactis]KST98531.1 hypothetical protein KF196_1499 [Lactococcus lactis subsp. lactis]